MKTIVVILCCALVALLVIFSSKMIAVIAPRLSFSFPLRVGTQEIRANLPAGRYVVVISTNSSNRVFSAIPAQCEYASEVSFVARDSRKLLLQGTNLYYEGFSLKKQNVGEVVFMIQVRQQKEGEQLVLHLGRSF